MAKRKLHIVPYTHWDREFRWEFERTRMRLVDCMDNLLDIMEKDPKYSSFLLDGQMAMIDDYLEIRPEKTADIARLVQQGRLEIGPWYTLTDHAPVNCECMIRNLLTGTRKAKQLGGYMRVGYSVFGFGQMSQLPQIYAGFGIDTICFYKHMDPSRTRYHEFIWEAPDGTQALTTRLGSEARWNYFFAAHIPIMYGRDPWHADWQYRWGDPFGKIFHTADPDGYSWFYDIIEPTSTFHPDRIKSAIERALKTVEGTACPDAVLMFDGTDFTEPHPLTSQVYEEIQKQCGEDIEVVHSTLTGYFDDLRKSIAKVEDLEVISGAMRDGPVTAIHSDVFSIHPELVLANSHAENILLRHAEPLSTLAWANGLKQYPVRYLEKAWKLLFQSQTHGSLHGLGPQTLVEGELSRLRESRLIADGLYRRAQQSITKEINTSKVEDGRFFAVVHNPCSFARTEVVEAYIDVPVDVNLDRIIIEDMDGNTVLVQEVERWKTRAGVYHPRSRNMPFYCHRIHLFFMANDVPALGYKVFKVKWNEKKEYPYPHEDWEAQHILADNLICGPNEAENDFISLRVNADGSLTLTDKATKKEYSNLNYFMDQGEIGNMWVSRRPNMDKEIISLGKPAQVSVHISGPLAVVFHIEASLILPAEFDWNKRKRSARNQEMPIHMEVVFRKNCRYVEVNTTIENNIKDHDLMVCFPSDINGPRTWAEGSFYVRNYPTHPKREGELRGNELARHPAHLWFDMWDGERGLAVLTEAAKDYEILEHNTPGTMCMGLVRGVQLRVPCDNRLWMEYPGDDSAQSLGKHTYRYALMPHGRRWDQAELNNHSIAFKAPMRVCQIGRQEGQFPLEKSLLSMEGENIVIAAIKRAEDRDSVLVRCFNPTGAGKRVTIQTGFPFTEAFLVRLDEERQRRLKPKGNAVTFMADSGKILTVEFALNHTSNKASLSPDSSPTEEPHEPE